MQNKTRCVLLLFLSVLLIECSNNQKVHSELAKLAANLNEAAPAQLDKYTVFLGAEVTPENIFQYRYKVINTSDAQKMMEEVETQTRANIQEAFKMNPDLKIFTQNEISIHYIYTDSVGKTLKIIRITPNDYN